MARVMACAENAGELDVDREVFHRLRTIVLACQEGSRITERLLSYAGRHPLHRQLVNPVNIIEHSIQMLEEDIAEAGIEITRDYAPVPDMMLDNVRMAELFTNLIRNAVDAMPCGGRLDVACAVEGGKVVIRMNDTGAGISPELLDRVFLPFVTTKGALSGSELPGMGLGLCVCQGILAAHGGGIDIESTPGKGTTLTIRLPLEVPDDGGAEPDTGGTT